MGSSYFGQGLFLNLVGSNGSKIFPQQPAESFHQEVRQFLKAELEGLDHTAVLNAKMLIKASLNDKNDFDAVNLRESYGEFERLY